MPAFNLPDGCNRLPCDDYDERCEICGSDTDPYGHLTWVCCLGSEEDEHADVHGDMMFCADYAVLPDGRLVVHIVANSESGAFIDTAAYEVLGPFTDPKAAGDAARDVFDSCCDAFDFYGVEGIDTEKVTGLRSTDEPWHVTTQKFGDAVANAYHVP